MFCQKLVDGYQKVKLAKGHLIFCLSKKKKKKKHNSKKSFKTYDVHVHDECV